MWYFKEMSSWIGQQRWKCSKEIKNGNIWSKLWISRSGIRELADHGNVNTAVVEPLDTMPTGPSEGKLRDIKEESSHEQKDEVSEEVRPAKKYNKGILGTVY